MSRDASGRLPVVVVVGRPNVGKSSLVNRILGRRESIVEAAPGVTRDRHSATAEWAGRRFEIVDTGGLASRQRGLELDAGEHARLAMDSADVIVLVVDAQVGLMEEDHMIAAALLRRAAEVMVVANKVDDPRDDPAAAEFLALGLGEPVTVSALHGTGSGDLLHALVDRLPEEVEGDAGAAWASLAIVGRPNVGKSSMLNALVGSSRAIVHPSPGTTRDPVDALVELERGRVLRVVDTAGIRRQVRIDDPIEYFSWLRSHQTLERVDAALLVVDATEGVTSYDQRIAQAIEERGRACVVALNKWDIAPADPAERRRVEGAIAHDLRWLPWAARLRTSAVTGRGVSRVLPALVAATEAHRRRVTTGRLNRIVQAAQEATPHARGSRGAVRVRYAVQTRASPPTFALFANARLEAGYLRYIERHLRAEEPLEGTPVHLRVRRSGDPLGAGPAHS